MLNHQDTKDTKIHQERHDPYCFSLVALGERGALVVKFFSFVFQHQVLLPSFSLNRRRIVSKNAVDVGAGVVKLCCSALGIAGHRLREDRQ